MSADRALIELLEPTCLPTLVIVKYGGDSAPPPIKVHYGPNRPFVSIFNNFVTPLYTQGGEITTISADRIAIRLLDPLVSNPG